MKVTKPIGGEQWFDINLFKNEINNFENADYTFSSGGQSSINFIVRQLKLKDDEVMLLPSYLCPTIVWNLERNKVNFHFYKIRGDLSIDIGDLDEKIGKYNARAVFFIDYFGFYHDSKTRGFLISLKERGIAVIEDAVQMLWFSRQDFIGDFVFNSYRKFLPIDGSIVLSEAAGKFESVLDEYYEYMNTARLKITAYVKYGLGNIEDFVELYSKADEVYGKSTAINGMTEISRYLLNKVDVESIGEVRRRNFCYLHDKLADQDNIKPLFSKGMLGINIPIGFPVMIRNRDNVKSALRQKAIYCPAHWPILDEPWVRDFSESIWLAENILTLPIDQRYEECDMDRLIGEILKLC
jgi:dTDP-4-amino-4,6-dideoxygalactose transaminase